MKPMFFLEGPTGIGKSSLIFEMVKKSKIPCRGFLSRRLLHADGSTGAFQLAAYHKADKPTGFYRGNEDNIFLRYPGRKNAEAVPAVFASLRELTGNWQEAKLLVLDEIGGMELQVPACREFLYEMLNSRIPCIGVLKSFDNYQHMKQYVNITRQTSEQYQKLRRRLETDDSCELYRMTVNSREMAADRVGQFLAECCMEAES